jgi:phage repressor protein C with HTH and peptisase S24 domain
MSIETPVKANPKLLRFLEYLEQKGLTAKYAEEILKVGNGRFGKMKANSTELREVLIENILKKFPDLSSDWLENGYGQMFSNILIEPNVVYEKKVGYIPVYDVTFTMGFNPTFINSQNTPEVLAYINFPELVGSKYVVKAKGNSMAPLINDRDFVGIRPVKNKKHIDYGNPYGVITEDLAVFKRIRTSKDESKLRLTSDNKEHDEFEIDKEEVIHLFSVIGILSVKSITY